jgi:polyribonucleotide nucleotidyltransferase
MATLGTLGEGQRLDGLTDEEPKTFLHHYNMPPYSTGEAYPMRGPSRRAIGHGALAERALRAVVPEADKFPYSLRLVSEAVSSNGSTSMASVCAGSLAMMDAGVPIEAAVGGMAMGIIHESPDNYIILTDIQGFEDHNGDMDFKVAGTREGINALQLDVKTQGLTPEILGQALLQAKDARMQVLDTMESAIAAPRPELSPFAPRVITIEIPQEKIGEVIGPGGKTIRKLEEYGVKIEIEEDGKVFVSGVDAEATDQAVQAIKDIVRVPEVGEVFEDATVVRLMPFGAFCEILPGKDGLLHVSDYAWEHTPSIADVLKVGDQVTVKIKEIDDQGRINLSRKAMLDKPEGASDDDGGGGRSDRGGRRSGSSSSRSRGRRKPRSGGGGSGGRGGGNGGGDGGGGDVKYRDKKRD